ncbi:MAG: CDP-diacylglycerol--glycerol-3-phosphate 3-phosphatidyltransferase [Eubacteriales bacterium]|nr:CDP-diacylglycerol--glycerol-3-phosphate 3-phosphatidyltransferase [Eubacteriales bacterium]
MNTPNKLTLIRIVLIPVFMVVYVLQFDIPYGKYVAALIFCAAAFTDFLDGYIARKNNIVTDFGKFMDPLADKLLVSTALILFVWNQRLNPFIVIIIVSRDFIISGVRLIAANKGKVIAASYWGKFKTLVQMLMILMLILDWSYPIYVHLTNFVVVLAFALTVISLVDYLWKNREFYIKG